MRLCVGRLLAFAIIAIAEEQGYVREPSFGELTYWECAFGDAVEAIDWMAGRITF